MSYLNRLSSELFGWAGASPAALGWLFGLSLLLFAGSLVLIPVLVARMRADYFVAPDPDEHSWFGRHPVARGATRVAKNTLGAVLLVAGIAMMVLPGQGIITVLVALSLLKFPGKRGLELLLIRQAMVSQAINWIREKAGRPPLILPRL